MPGSRGPALDLPPPATLFPENRRAAVVAFWVRYWWFIEASLFPWRRRWSWENWFNDESGRLFSAGEFSRTYFVRSLSATPERVPARFPPFARLVGWLSGRLPGRAGRDG